MRGRLLQPFERALQRMLAGLLNKIMQATLVVNGIDDVMIATINFLYLAQNIPDAQLILYPDAGHGVSVGAHFQYPERFLKHAIQLLDE